MADNADSNVEKQSKAVVKSKADIEPKEADQSQIHTKVVVITGASSGIGRATALEFATQGYNVVLAARRQNELQEIAKECEELGVRSLAVPLDTTNNSAVQSLAQKAASTFGRIDVWINNAAVYLTGKFDNLPQEDMKRVMDVNFFGYVNGSQAALQQFRTQGNGTLINVSSINAAAPQPYVSVYSASKAAVRAFDESLRMELNLEDALDIHICTVMPSTVDTNLFQNSANYTGKELQAVEPVYDPSYAAKQIFRLVRKPKRETIIGPAGKMMAFQNTFMPSLYERQFARFTRNELLADDDTSTSSSGNLYQSIDDNRGTHGGWQDRRLSAKQLNTNPAIGAGIVAGITGLAIIALSRRQKT